MQKYSDIIAINLVQYPSCIMRTNFVIPSNTIVHPVYVEKTLLNSINSVYTNKIWYCKAGPYYSLKEAPTPSYIVILFDELIRVQNKWCIGFEVPSHNCRFIHETN